MKKIELLAPAGSFDSLKAVIEAGCDAVYLGGYMFGARSFAHNFSNEEIAEAIKYAHLYGVKVYVTVNTLIYEDEIDECMKFIDFIHQNNVDAILVQDLGILDLVRKTYPNLEVHASTQMHLHNLEAVKLMEKIGVKRVVLARETNIKLLKEIIDNTKLEIETFIHGALCVSYSGQCLMSSLIGGRSGNRGSCAGCCRQKYNLISKNKKVNKDEYLLSMKDLNTIKDIGKLIDIGVTSLKIEGRTKRPEYGYLIVSMYRKAIDNYLKCGETLITDEDLEKITEIFNRKFTKGYLFNEENKDVINEYRPNHMGVVIGKVIYSDKSKIKIKLTKDITKEDGIRIFDDIEDFGLNLVIFKVNGKVVTEADKDDIIEIEVKNSVKVNSDVVRTTNIKDLNMINNLIESSQRKVKVNSNIYMHLNETMWLSFNDGINEVKVVSNYIVQSSINNPTTKERIIEQISKLGDTVYEINNLNTDIDDNIFIPIKEINELRRQVVNELNNKRLYKIEYKKDNYTIEVEDFSKSENINYLINSKYQYDQIKELNVTNIFTPNLELFNEIKNDKRVALKLSNVIEHHFDYKELLLISEIGSINKYNNFYTDYNFNVTNSYAVAFLHSLGSKRVTLSHELNKEQITNIINNYIGRYNKRPNLEIIIYGREIVMTTKFDLLSYYHLKEGELQDRFKNKYPLIYNNDLIDIYNYHPKDIKDYQEYFNLGINNVRYNILFDEEIENKILNN